MAAEKIRVTAQVLNGATGQIYEVVANVAADNEQDAVDLLFSKARTDDYYYRFLGRCGVVEPSQQANPFHYSGQTYFARETQGG